MKTGRNDPCPCGSGKKFKHCCINKPPAPPAPLTAAQKQAVILAERELKDEVYASDLYAGLMRKLGRRPTNKEWDRAQLAAKKKFEPEVLKALQDVEGGMYAYAFKKTGFIVFDLKTRKENPVLAAKWDAAIAHWKKAHGVMHALQDSSGEKNETL